MRECEGWVYNCMVERERADRYYRTDVVMTNAAPAGDLASACVPEVAATELHVAPPADDLACARCVTARMAESTELDFECGPDPVFPPTVSVPPPTVLPAGDLAYACVAAAATGKVQKAQAKPSGLTAPAA